MSHAFSKEGFPSCAWVKPVTGEVLGLRGKSKAKSRQGHIAQDVTIIRQSDHDRTLADLSEARRNLGAVEDAFEGMLGGRHHAMGDRFVPRGASLEQWEDALKSFTKRFKSLQSEAEELRHMKEVVA